MLVPSNHYRTNLEKIVLNKLIKLNIPVIEQWSTRSGFVPDFVIVGQSIIVEADGPCHDTPEAIKKCKYRDKILKHEGWKHIVHLSQPEILDDNILTKKIEGIKKLYE